MHVKWLFVLFRSVIHTCIDQRKNTLEIKQWRAGLVVRWGICHKGYNKNITYFYIYSFLITIVFEQNTFFYYYVYYLLYIYIFSYYLLYSIFIHYFVYFVYIIIFIM